jgi:hypothetical protein
MPTPPLGWIPSAAPIYTRVTISGEIEGDHMSRSQAARARRRAQQALAYRAWYIAPATAAVPPIEVLTDPSLQRREKDRQLRRAAAGSFDTIAPVVSHRAAA